MRPCGSRACQVPQSTGFSRQEYWSGLRCPPLGDLTNPGMEPTSPVASALQANSLLLSHQESPREGWRQPAMMIWSILYLLDARHWLSPGYCSHKASRWWYSPFIRMRKQVSERQSEFTRVPELLVKFIYLTCGYFLALQREVYISLYTMTSIGPTWTTKHHPVLLPRWSWEPQASTHECWCWQPYTVCAALGHSHLPLFDLHHGPVRRDTNAILESSLEGK